MTTRTLFQTLAGTPYVAPVTHRSKRVGSPSFADAPMSSLEFLSSPTAVAVTPYSHENLTPTRRKMPIMPTDDGPSESDEEMPLTRHSAPSALSPELSANSSADSMSSDLDFGSEPEYSMHDSSEEVSPPLQAHDATTGGVVRSSASSYVVCHDTQSPALSSQLTGQWGRLSPFELSFGSDDAATYSCSPPIASSPAAQTRTMLTIPSSSPPLSTMQWSDDRRMSSFGEESSLQLPWMNPHSNEGEYLTQSASATSSTSSHPSSFPVRSSAFHVSSSWQQQQRRQVHSVHHPAMSTRPMELSDRYDEAFEEDRRKRRRLLPGEFYRDRLTRPSAFAINDAAFHSQGLLSSRAPISAVLHGGSYSHVSAFSSPDPRDCRSSFAALSEAAETVHQLQLEMDRTVSAGACGSRMSSSSHSNTSQFAAAAACSSSSQTHVPPPSSSPPQSSSSSSSCPSPPIAYLIPSDYLRSPDEKHDTASITSVIKHLYGFSDEEMGHRTYGHACISREEIALAASGKHDLLYGEVLPLGATKFFDRHHLDLRSARTLCDLGSGLGKLAIQAFLQYPNLRRVFGCELSASRFQKSCEAVSKLYQTRKQFKSHCQQKQLERIVEEQSDDIEHEQKVGTADENSVAQRVPLLPHVAMQSERATNTNMKLSSVTFTESIATTMPSRTVRHTAAVAASNSASTSSSQKVDVMWTNLHQYDAFLAAAPVQTSTLTLPKQRVVRSLDEDEIGGGGCANESPTQQPNSSDRVARVLIEEYAASRVAAVNRMHRNVASSFAHDPSRTLELHCKNLFELTEAFEADVVICETKFSEENYPALCRFLLRFKVGCRLLTYENLDYVFMRVYGDGSSCVEERKEDESHAMDDSTTTSHDVSPPNSPSVDSFAPVARRTRSGAHSSEYAISASSKRKRKKRTAALVNEYVESNTTPSSSTARSPASSLAEPTTGRHSSSASSGDSVDPPSSNSSSNVPPHPMNPFKQLPINLSKTDRFYTTWASNLGHHFFLYCRE